MSQEYGFYGSVCLTVINPVIFLPDISSGSRNISLNTDGLCVQQFKETLPSLNYSCPLVVTNVFSSVLGKFGMVRASSFILHLK